MNSETNEFEKKSEEQPAIDIQSFSNNKMRESNLNFQKNERFEANQCQNEEQSVHILVQQDSIQKGQDFIEKGCEIDNCIKEQQIRDTMSRINIHVLESKDISLWHPRIYEEPARQLTPQNDLQFIKEQNLKPEESSLKFQICQRNLQEMSLVYIDLFSEQQQGDRKQMELTMLNQKIHIHPKSAQEQKTYIEQEIQTSNLLQATNKQQTECKIDQNLSKSEKRSSLENRRSNLENGRNNLENGRSSLENGRQIKFLTLGQIKQQQQKSSISMAQNNQNEVIQPVLLNNEVLLINNNEVLINNNEVLINNKEVLIRDKSQIKRVHFQDDGKSNKIEGQPAINSNEIKHEQFTYQEVQNKQEQSKQRVIKEQNKQRVIKDQNKQRVIKEQSKGCITKDVSTALSESQYAKLQQREIQERKKSRQTEYDMKMVIKENERKQGMKINEQEIENKLLLIEQEGLQSLSLEQLGYVSVSSYDQLIKILTEKLEKLKLKYSQLTQQPVNSQLNKQFQQYVQLKQHSQFLQFKQHSQFVQQKVNLQSKGRQQHLAKPQTKQQIQIQQENSRYLNKLQSVDNDKSLNGVDNDKSLNGVNRKQQLIRNMKMMKAYDYTIIVAASIQNPNRIPQHKQINNKNNNQKLNQKQITQQVDDPLKYKLQINPLQFCINPTQNQMRINPIQKTINKTQQNQRLFKQFSPQNYQHTQENKQQQDKNNQQLNDSQNIAKQVCEQRKIQIVQSKIGQFSPQINSYIQQRNLEGQQPQFSQQNSHNSVNDSNTNLQEDHQQMKTKTLSIITKSYTNILTLKESIETLSYERIKALMNLDATTLSKISFKKKHFPSQVSNEKELKLYGKRLLKFLVRQVNVNDQILDSIKIQSQVDYERTDTYVAYFLKHNTNFIIICYYNKTIYIGPFIVQDPLNQLVRQGYGIQIRQSKYIYQGDFFADKKHGHGYMQFLNSKSHKIYCGQWMDGFMDGHGKQIHNTGQLYQGEFKLGFRDGIGSIYYDQQKLYGYQGQFYDGLKHGKGYQIFLNGDKYTGSFLKDKFHGQGEYQWKNGTKYQGTFHQGQKHGQGKLILTNGKQFNKYYDHNRQIDLQNNFHQKDKISIQSSRLSLSNQSKIEEKPSRIKNKHSRIEDQHLKIQDKPFQIQDKPKSLLKYRSLSGKSLFSNKSVSQEKSLKKLDSKKNIAQLIKQKQIQEDIKNLDIILKPQGNAKKIFSLQKLNPSNVLGKMYNITDRPTIKLSQHNGLDMLKLGNMGSQRKSLISFNQQDRLQQLKDSTYKQRGYPMTNFSQF